MDISKEREEYLKMLVGNDAISNDQANALRLMSGDSHFYTYGNQVSVAKLDLINWGWNSWLAAKQQAVPDGFVVASTDSLKKAIGFMCTAQCHPNNTKGYEQEIEELISSFEIMIQESQK